MEGSLSKAYEARTIQKAPSRPHPIEIPSLPPELSRQIFLTEDSPSHMLREMTEKDIISCIGNFYDSSIRIKPDALQMLHGITENHKEKGEPPTMNKMRQIIDRLAEGCCREGMEDALGQSLKDMYAALDELESDPLSALGMTIQVNSIVCPDGSIRPSGVLRTETMAGPHGEKTLLVTPETVSTIG